MMNRYFKSVLAVVVIGTLPCLGNSTYDLPQWPDVYPDSLPHPIVSSDGDFNAEVLKCKIIKGGGRYWIDNEMISGDSIANIVGFQHTLKSEKKPARVNQKVLLYMHVEPEDKATRIGSRYILYKEISILGDKLRDALRIGRNIRDGKVKIKSFEGIECGKAGGVSISVWHDNISNVYFSIENEEKVSASFLLDKIHYLINGVDAVQKWFDTGKPASTPQK